MISFQHMAVFLCLSPIIDFILFSCSFLFQVDLLLLMCEAQWFWNCIMYQGPWYHGLALFSSNPFLVFSATWLFEVVLTCFILWICVCRASVFGRSHLFFSDNAATRLGCTQSRHSGCTCSETIYNVNIYNYIQCIYNTILWCTSSEKRAVKTKAWEGDWCSVRIKRTS